VSSQEESEEEQMEVVEEVGGIPVVVNEQKDKDKGDQGEQEEVQWDLFIDWDRSGGVAQGFGREMGAE
jgi:hypothetical protein